MGAIIHHGDGGNNGRQTQIVIRITDNQSHATTDIQQHSETDIRGRHLFCSISACTEYVSAKSSVQHKPCIQRAWAQAHGHSTCSLLTMTFIFTFTFTDSQLTTTQRTTCDMTFVHCNSNSKSIV